MTVAIEVVKDQRGDFQVHVAGCADVAKQVKANPDNDGKPDHYEGETIVEALVALDTESASWFGVDDPYSEQAYEQGCWSHQNMNIAPCLRSQMRHVTYETTDENDPRGGHVPPIAATSPSPAEFKQSAERLANPEEWTYGDPCQCGCGGQPKGKRSRFVPGHDARMQHKA